MILPYLAALAVGATLAIQAIVNARFASAVGSLYWTAGVSAGITSVLAMALGAALTGAPRLLATTALPAWAWTGGLLGIIILAGAPFAASRLGALAFVVLVVFGQVGTALLLDLAIAGASSLTILRICGTVTVVAGAAMVALAR